MRHMPNDRTAVERNVFDLTTMPLDNDNAGSVKQELFDDCDLIPFGQVYNGMKEDSDNMTGFVPTFEQLINVKVDDGLSEFLPAFDQGHDAIGPSLYEGSRMDLSEFDFETGDEFGQPRVTHLKLASSVLDPLSNFKAEMKQEAFGFPDLTSDILGMKPQHGPEFGSPTQWPALPTVKQEASGSAYDPDYHYEPTYEDLSAAGTLDTGGLDYAWGISHQDASSSSSLTRNVFDVTPTAYPWPTDAYHLETRVPTVHEQPALETRHHDAECRAEDDAPPPSVAVSTKKQDGRRKWDKKNICFFCGRALSNIGRHLGNLHGAEPEVVAYLRHPKLSAERKDLIGDLVKRGNFKHNSSVLRHGNGVIVPKKRPNEPKQTKEFLPCDACYGFFVRENLAKHQKVCSPDVTPGAHRNAKTRGSLLLDPNEYGSREFRDKVLLRMNQDEVFEVVKGDGLITAFGSLSYERLASKKMQHVRNISFHLRELAGLLMRLRQISKVRHFRDCFEVRNYRYLVDAVKHVGKYDEGTGKFGVPSLANKMGAYVRKCGWILVDGCSRAGDEVGKRRAEAFLQAMDDRWHADVTSRAGGGAGARRRREGGRTRKDRHSKRPWSAEEKAEVMRHFDESIRTKKTPGKVECDKCKAENECLKGRSWSDIKFCVYNQIRKTF